MKKTLLTVLSVAVIALAGCKKDSSNKPSTTLSDSYWPTTSGNSWTYKDVTGAGTINFTINMTGATSTINGKTYYAASAVKNGASITSYIYAANHTYALRGVLQGIGLSVELPLCNDNEPAGYTWTVQPTADGTVNGIPAQAINKIVSVNGSMTVNGKTYANVIHTQVDLQYDFGGGFESAMTYDFYLAKGIGMIEGDTSSGGASIESETLTSYSVK